MFETEIEWDFGLFDVVVDIGGSETHDWCHARNEVRNEEYDQWREIFNVV